MRFIDLLVVIYRISVFYKALVGLIGYRRLGAAMVHRRDEIERGRKLSRVHRTSKANAIKIAHALLLASCVNGFNYLEYFLVASHGSISGIEDMVGAVVTTVKKYREVRCVLAADVKYKLCARGKGATDEVLVHHIHAVIVEISAKVVNVILDGMYHLASRPTGEGAVLPGALVESYLADCQRIIQR